MHEVNVKTRAIKATLTRELADDLNMYHGLNIDNELNSILMMELSKERRERRKESINKIFNL
jgi:hypothetical protein